MRKHTLFTIFLGIGSCFASTITVQNPSFEILPPGGLPFTCTPAGSGCTYSNGDIPGWTISNQTNIVGEFQPGVSSGNTTYFNTLPDGPTIAYSSGGVISQTVGATVQLGVAYILLVDVGQRNDWNGLGTVDLEIGNTLIAATGEDPAPGDWSTFMATYIGQAADVGDPISIVLSATGNQGDFDNVRLYDAPEPATVYLFVFGLAAIAPAMRKRRRLHS